MDAKALAKSKRAHSQHLNKKHHRNPSSKAPSASPSGTDDPKKPPGRQLPEKTHQFRGSKPLPSNWDRYEEEYDSVLDDPSVKNTIQTVDAVPKSKGADYGYLISEAESQSTSNIQLDSSPLFDDVLTDFYQGYGSLLSAKGQGIQQRLEDENFVVEDEATSSNEASFLSLDLHLLAEQLGKIDLARRLFIEPEMLPPELVCCTDQSQIRSSESEAAASGSEEVKLNSTRQVTVHPGLGDSLDDLPEETSNSILEGIASVQLDPTQPLRTRPDMPKPTSVSPSLNSALDDLFEETSSSYIIGGAASVQLDPSETLRNSSALSKPSVVVAANFDDDLDDLLNETSTIQKSGLARKCTDQSQIRFSESETAASGSEEAKINSTRQVTVHPGLGDSLDDLLEQTSNSILEGIASVQLDPTQPLRTTHPDMPKPISVSSNLNSALDDLFEETSSSYIIGRAASVQLDPSETLRNSSALSKPKPSVVVAANFDDDLDDLLNETSRIQKSGLSREVIMPAHANKTLSSSSSISSKSKALDDFDAWFDTV